jgi:hypothetical protein
LEVEQVPPCCFLTIDALQDARRIPMHDGKLFDPGIGTTAFSLTRSSFSRPGTGAIERCLIAGIAAEMRAHDAPTELYNRYGSASGCESLVAY